MIFCFSPVKPLTCMVKRSPGSTKAQNNCASNCSQKIKKYNKITYYNLEQCIVEIKKTDNKNKQKITQVKHHIKTYKANCMGKTKHI